MYYVDEVAATIERLGSERLYLLQGLNQDSKTVMQAPTLSLGQYAVCMHGRCSARSHRTAALIARRAGASDAR